MFSPVNDEGNSGRYPMMCFAGMQREWANECSCKRLVLTCTLGLQRKVVRLKERRSLIGIKRRKTSVQTEPDGLKKGYSGQTTILKFVGASMAIQRMESRGTIRRSEPIFGR